MTPSPHPHIFGSLSSLCYIGPWTRSRAPIYSKIPRTCSSSLSSKSVRPFSPPESCYVLRTAGLDQQCAYFEDPFICCPHVLHHGFTSWDFCTRQSRPGIQPVEYSNNDLIILQVEVNAQFWLKRQSYFLTNMTCWLPNSPMTWSIKRSSAQPVTIVYQ